MLTCDHTLLWSHVVLYRSFWKPGILRQSLGCSIWWIWRRRVYEWIVLWRCNCFRLLVEHGVEPERFFLVFIYVYLPRTIASILVNCYQWAFLPSLRNTYKWPYFFLFVCFLYFCFFVLWLKLNNIDLKFWINAEINFLICLNFLFDWAAGIISRLFLQQRTFSVKLLYPDKSYFSLYRTYINKLIIFKVLWRWG